MTNTLFYGFLKKRRNGEALGISFFLFFSSGACPVVNCPKDAAERLAVPPRNGQTASIEILRVETCWEQEDARQDTGI